MARLTIEQYIASLKRQSKELRDSKAPFVAAQTAHADMVERIFTRGDAADGGKIGSYDTKDPLYVNPKNSPVNVAPKGKTGKRVFDNGKPHKTAYFQNYKAYRANIGRPTATVNLDLFGRLKQEFENSMRRISNSSFEARSRTSESTDKALGNQSRFRKPIFAATQAERDTFRDVLVFELRKIYA